MRKGRVTGMQNCLVWGTRISRLEVWVVVREMLETEIFGGSILIDNDSYLDTCPLLLSTI